MDQIKTGRLIRALRQGQNLTQAELGEKLGVGGKAVSKWECGAGAPDIALLLRKLYPQWDLSARLPYFPRGTLLWYDTREGLLYQEVR